MIIVANSLNVIVADRLVEIDETKRNVIQIFLFDVLSVDLFVKDRWFDVCVASISFFIKRCLNVSRRWLL